MKKAFLFKTVLLFVFCFTSNAFSYVSETQKGVAVYDFISGFEDYEIDSDGSSIILGDWFDQSKAVFYFYLPPEVETHNIDYLKVTVNGTGTMDEIKFGGPTAVFWTNITNTATFEFPNLEHPSITINDLLESNGDSLSGRRLRIQIDITATSSSYVLHSITIQYNYAGVSDQRVENFMEVYTAYLNIKSSSEMIYQRWDSGAYTSELMFWLGWTRAMGTMVMSAFNEVVGGLVNWGIGNIPWFSFVDMADIAGDITWFRNSNGDYYKDDIDDKCVAAYQDCETLALLWKQGFDSPDAAAIEAEISDLETKLNSLEGTLNQAVSTGLFQLYDIYTKRWTYGDGTPASSHEGDLMAEVMMRSFAPLIAYDFSEIQTPTARSDSFIYKLKQTLSEQQNEFVEVTIAVSPSGKNLKFKVDSVEYPESQTFHWANGSSHTIEATSPQTGNDLNEYIFQCWSDGGDRIRTISPTTDATITANFTIGSDFTLTSVADSIVMEDDPARNNGSLPILQIDREIPGHDIFGLIKFNLSSLPAGSTINSVELRLSVAQYPSSPYAHQISLLRIISTWDEYIVTWNNKPINPYSDPVIAGYIDQGNIPVWTWDSATYPELKTLAQNWFNNPSTNYGISVIGGPGQPGVSFYSREDFDQSHRPKLVISYTSPPPDIIPPTPNPMDWATQPYATSSSSITMIATTASDSSGVEYYFDEISGNSGGNDSGWQSSTSYTDTGLSQGTTYTYTVKARDKSPQHNETSPSVSRSATTPYYPVISNLQPTSGPPGTYMKIQGSHFYSSGSVIFAGGAAGQILSWSDTEILCKVPSGASSGNVVVQTSVSSNGVNYTVTDPTTLYVDDDYTPNTENGTTTYPFSTVQRGIDAATTGDEVVVAEGTYTGQGNRDIELRKAITVRSSNPTDPNIVDVTIIDCQGSASEPHRGFNMQGGLWSGPILNGLTIENGYADYGGGISCRIQNDKSIIINCIIRNNTADYGGGMYSSEMYSDRYGPTVTNCIFSGNVSNNQGGGMYISYGITIMTNCVFTGNVANSDGGGIYGQAIVITDCTISSNTSYGFGGGICGYGGRSGGSALITACNISKNTSVLGAGGIKCGYLNISDSTINENESNGSGGGVTSGSATINNCVISNNTSKGVGGGISSVSLGYTTTITDCNFIGNNAVSGGGIAGWFGGPATVSHCTFTENSAGFGGGMYMQLSDYSPTVTNCVFTANIADTYGGGMYNRYHSSPTVMNCIFAGNISLQSGGAICNIMWSSPIITNCTLSANSADISGGGMFSIDSNSIVENCILWGNTATDGNEVALAGSSTIDLNYNDVGGGSAGIYTDTNSTLNWRQGNIDVDPCFADTGYWDSNGTPEDANDDFWVEGNYHLLPDSLCIDAGDPNYPYDPNKHDIDGDARIIGGRIDIGADEYTYRIVNFEDFAILANYWMDYICTEPSWCEGCDYDHNGTVDILDLATFADHWLEGTSP